MVTALALSGCTGSADGADGADAPAGSRTPSSTRDPDVERHGDQEQADVALATAVLRAERAVLAQVVATVRRHPRLVASVSGARAAHRAHVALLQEAVPGAARSSGPSPDASTDPRTPRVPIRPGAALAALAIAEARLSAAGVRHAGQARSGAFARVLASMAAASAQQAAVLSEAARRRR